MSRAAKKTASKRTVTRKSAEEEPVVPEESQLTPEQQAAIDAENFRFGQFQQAQNLQYWQSRCVELATEVEELRKVIGVMQVRLQDFEDSK